MKRLVLALLAALFVLTSVSALERRRKAPVVGTVVTASSALVPYWTDGVKLGNFDSSANWQELSGLATPNNPANANYMWVMSDAPANMLAAVLKSNGSNQGVWDFQTPPTYVDVEDVETAVVGGVNYLYFMDFGNNGNAANSRGAGIDMRILRAIEPTITGSNGTISSGNYIQIDAAFPGGSPPTLRDCEATIVDSTGKIWIIIKRDAAQEVYSLDHAATYSGTQTLTYEGNMWAMPSATTNALGATATYAVDAAMNPAGTEILVKNYNNIYYFPRDPATQSVIQALQQTGTDLKGYVGGGSSSALSIRTSHPNAEPQGEGIAYDSTGRDLYSNSEFNSTEGSTSTRYPLFKYSRIPKAPTTIVFQEGVSPTGSYAGTADTYIWDTNPTTDNGAATTMVLDKAIGVETDQRKALLKFDLSAIPTNAVVVGCTLRVWISAEGQGWAWYRMLVPWTESSTYNSLVGGVNDDNVEASSTESARNGVNLDTILNVTARDNMLVSDCQAMVTNPSTNYGWLGEGTDITGGDGVQFDSSESATASHRPELTIRYYVP